MKKNEDVVQGNCFVSFLRFFFVLQDFGLIFEAKTCSPLPKIPVGMGCQSPKSTLPLFHCSWSANVHDSHLFMTKNQTTFSSFWSWSAIFSSQKLEQKQGIQYTNQADLEAL